MGEDNIKEWVEEKLQRGVKSDKIRDALDRKGKDTSALDEALSEASDKHDKGDDSKEAEEGSKRVNEKDTDQKDPQSEDESGEDFTAILKLNKSKEIAEELEQSISSNKLEGLTAITVVFLIILGGGLFFTDSAGSIFEDKSNRSDEVSGSKALMPSSEFDGEEIVLKTGLAEPSRPSVDPGEKVAFINNNTYGLRIEFENKARNMMLEPETHGIISFNTIAYYSGYHNGTESVKGSVYVE